MKLEGRSRGHSRPIWEDRGTHLSFCVRQLDALGGAEALEVLQHGRPQRRWPDFIDCPRGATPPPHFFASGVHGRSEMCGACCRLGYLFNVRRRSGGVAIVVFLYLSVCSALALLLDCFPE